MARGKAGSSRVALTHLRIKRQSSCMRAGQGRGVGQIARGRKMVATSSDCQVVCWGVQHLGLGMGGGQCGKMMSGTHDTQRTFWRLDCRQDEGRGRRLLQACEGVPQITVTGRGMSGRDGTSMPTAATNVHGLVSL